MILGKNAARLRARGLELRVVQLPGELDYKSKREQELARRSLAQEIKRNKDEVCQLFV